MSQPSDLLRYVDPDNGWTPSQQLQDVTSELLDALEELHSWELADSAKVIMVMRLAFVALAPGNDLTTATALLPSLK